MDRARRQPPLPPPITKNIFKGNLCATKNIEKALFLNLPLSVVATEQQQKKELRKFYRSQTDRPAAHPFAQLIESNLSVSILLLTFVQLTNFVLLCAIH